MAKSPAHKFGQDLGQLIEEVVLDDVLRPQLESFTRERGYYLDAKGARPARRGVKVTWPDRYGNNHDLDFVIEIGGTAQVLGRPIAFIEAAWRRYTKHSKNKAQEIQGAVLPLIDVHREQAPFHGAVLAGEFTQPAVQQLRSQGFTVVHLSYATVVDAFAAAGIDIDFDEGTAVAKFTAASKRLAKLSTTQRMQVRQTIVDECSAALDGFMATLRAVLTRLVVRIVVRTTWGEEHDCASVASARKAIESLDTATPRGRFLRYELQVKYSNGDTIDASFEAAPDAIQFLSRVV